MLTHVRLRPTFDQALMKRVAGTQTKAHTDLSRRPEDEEIKIHFRITTNAYVALPLERKPIELQSGTSGCTNFNLVHSVINHMVTARARLVHNHSVDDETLTRLTNKFAATA